MGCQGSFAHGRLCRCGLATERSVLQALATAFGLTTTVLYLDCFSAYHLQTLSIILKRSSVLRLWSL